MTDKVIDASALAALAFQETRAADVLSRIDGHDLHAPLLLLIEMVSVCLKKMRAESGQKSEILRQHNGSLAMRVQAYDVDPSAVLILADQLGLSAYDASYLWLARELNVDLVTLDDRLAKASAKP